jgi:CRISPR-associated protein Csm4
MKTYLYRLHFEGPVHFGQSGIGLEETSEALPSDSLVSALINASAITGNLEQFLGSLCAEEPGVRFSSLFPFGPDPVGGNDCVYVVPRPLVMPPSTDPDLLGIMGKDLKRLKYILAEDLGRWLNGPLLSSQELAALLDRNKGLARPWDPEEKSGWWAEELRPRVALDRSSQKSSIWWCASIRFVHGAGLYGLVRVGDKRQLDGIQTAFRMLGEMGLGGERTYGMGLFRFSGFHGLVDVWPAWEGPSAEGRLLLSRYYPASGERHLLEEALTAWDFVETRGHVVTGRYATTLKRKRVRMLREGSVARQSLKGSMVDVTPAAGETLGLHHRVYRCGLGFWMGTGGFE